MAALPYMKLYPGDYFGDTGHLTCLQHGIYMQLILRYFIRGGPLPDDDRYLAGLVRLGPREWRRHRELIAAYFQVVGGEWVHKRIEQELAAAQAKSLQSREARLTGVRRPSNGRSTPVERTFNESESESQSPSSIDIELGRACARDSLDSRKERKTAKPKIRFDFDDEETSMRPVREALFGKIGAASYALFCDPKRPVRFIVEEGRIVACCPTDLMHTFVRDHEITLARIAKAQGYSDGWIRPRNPEGE